MTNKLKNKEKAQTITSAYNLGIQSGNESMARQALGRYKRLVETLGYDPLV